MSSIPVSAHDRVAIVAAYINGVTPKELVEKFFIYTYNQIKYVVYVMFKSLASAMRGNTRMFVPRPKKRRKSKVGCYGTSKKGY